MSDSNDDAPRSEQAAGQDDTYPQDAAAKPAPKRRTRKAEADAEPAPAPKRKARGKAAEAVASATPVPEPAAPSKRKASGKASSSKANPSKAKLSDEAAASDEPAEAQPAKPSKVPAKTRAKSVAESAAKSAAKPVAKPASGSSDDAASAPGGAASAVEAALPAPEAVVAPSPAAEPTAAKPAAAKPAAASKRKRAETRADEAAADAGETVEAAPAPAEAPAEMTRVAPEAAAPQQARETRRGAPTGDAVLRRPGKPAATSAKPAATSAKPAATSAKPAASPAKPASSREAPAEPAAESERIAKVIARAGLASRRDAEAMILEGRVTLNGQRLDSPAMNVGPDDRITVDGEALPARERTRLWLLHKPRGVVTTARDPEGRPTVFDGLPEDLPRVVTIGRLDINTEGLLLLTNDGGLAKVIAHPETGWLRRYRVRAYGDVDQAALDRLRGGVTIDGMEYGPVEATIDRQQGDNVWLTFGLREGKNREVKRILEHLGLSVNRLIRLSFGPFQLGDLEVGLVEEVRTKVLREQLGRTLADQAGVDFESPVREPIAPFGSPKAAAQPERGDGRGARPPREGGRDTGGRDRGGRDPARPQASRTQAARPNAPQRRVWRDEEAEGEPTQRPRIPRRGADPQQARAASAERPRERVGAIASGERRVVVERLVAPPQEEAAPHRRTRFGSRDAGSGEGRPPRRPRDEGGSRERGAGTGGKRSYGGRSGGGPEAREFRGAPRGAGKGAPKGAFRRDDARGGDERPSRGFRQDGGGQGGPRTGAGGKSFEGKSFGGKSSGGKSSGGKSPGGRSFGSKSSGERSFGGKPGGGGRPGGKPGGFKSGGRPGGGSRGGRPGGARPPRG